MKPSLRQNVRTTLWSFSPTICARGAIIGIIRNAFAVLLPTKNSRKTMNTKDLKVTVKVFVESVSGVMVEAEGWSDISLNEASFRMKDAFKRYDQPTVKIY